MLILLILGADLKSGGLASGLTGRQDRPRGDSMVFAETPLWSFEGPFQEGLVKDLDYVCSNSKLERIFSNF